MKYLLVCDLDDTLTGDKAGVLCFNKITASDNFHLVFSSGRYKESMISLIMQTGLVYPDVLVANLGTEIYYGPNWTLDKNWEHRIKESWNKEEITKVLDNFDLQPQAYNKNYVIPYYNDDESVVQEIKKKIGACNAKPVHTKKQFLDIIPKLAGKGNSARYISCKLKLSLICCGDSENDVEMLKKSDYGILVGNASNSLKIEMSKYSNVYVAKMFHALGVIEGLIHHGFIS